MTRTADHFYYHAPSKIYVPSVTKVLDIISKGEHFNNWLKKNGANSDKLVSEAADFGTNIHNFLELIGKGIAVNLDALTPKQRRCVEAFNKWKEENVQEFVETEQSICTPDYGGTLDAIIKIKNTNRGEGELAILDYKTSGYIYDTYDLQVAAYVKAYELNTGKKIDKAYILRFEKKEEKQQDLEVKEVKDLDYKFDLFMCALKLWNWKNKEALDKVNGGK